MIVAVRQYFETLIESAGNGWNLFWYRPTDGNSACLASADRRRFRVSVAVLVQLRTHGDVRREWLGVSASDSSSDHRRDLAKSAPGFSHMFWVTSATGLWICHSIGLVILGALAIGYRPRATTPLSLLVVLSYIHRAPVMVSTFETVLSMLLLYLCLAPDRRLSLASLRSFRELQPSKCNESWLSNVCGRLIQVHICALYLVIATSKLGTPDWWSGLAPATLLLDEHRRLINLESWTNNDYLMDALAHAWVAFELSFPVLVWNRTLRPVVSRNRSVVWVFTALVTGQVGYCLLMAVANLAFCEARE